MNVLEVKGDIGFFAYRIRNPKDVKEIAEPALVVEEII